MFLDSFFFLSYVSMDGIYLPEGRKLALIDRDWILDELPHLGNPDNNSDANYLLASAAAANSATSTTAGSSTGRSTTAVGTGAGPTHGRTPHTTTGGAGDAIGIDTGRGTTAIHHDITTNHNHSLLYNPDEVDNDLTLLSEIIDETQNKWSDFALNQLLTPYARSLQPKLK